MVKYIEVRRIMIKNAVAMFLASCLFVLGFAILAPIMSETEGKLLPVVSGMTVTEELKVDDGIIISGHFEKNRSCEFVSLEWRTANGERVQYDFFETGDSVSRPVGSQVVGPWILFDIKTLNGLEAIVTHRCHPLWLTLTKFYP